MFCSIFLECIKVWNCEEEFQNDIGSWLTFLLLEEKIFFVLASKGILNCKLGHARTRFHFSTIYYLKGKKRYARKKRLFLWIFSLLFRLSTICKTLRFCPMLLMIQYCSFTSGTLVAETCRKIFSMHNTQQRYDFSIAFRTECTYIFVDKRGSLAQREIKYSLHVWSKKFSYRMI